MKLSQQEVERIATLARLKLTEEEKNRYSQELSKIFDYMDKLQALDTAAVEPTSQVTGLTNVMREDVVEEFDNVGGLLAVSPQSQNGFFQVPKILENK
ncbi:MAG TPA: Asp-tRNA(Asn)/Glu-tRNA(Gln) amidotransferase subunit GatC [bacterium]|nr:Asp-tRNA(Asn)/Glu-tRNA(Gln) amidotransferase subunit GatC [bacterium]HNS34317.1 Asp-tRNA(Asn)/Glu-tRNA(Gln) amidotransferase subunit GatC [bacterium]HNZ73693.1 Asp-tRNA(Asn)/Glu-tRNA(Gln) amidotransferase subunit GatC [bacterium]HOH67579.1 Asp-tRNA(Asn)/Glu-tRNA(Gln) amidotransferase subunit GatC [bacterium]HQA63549.1 Asp-tRNA(Asn)/Glu-tRNA(Gln) amidotransferase subunit GatC [bacterium]